MYFSGELLKKARLSVDGCGLSLGHVAKIFRELYPNSERVTKTGLTGWERGRHQPSAGALGKLASLFGVDVSYFYYCDEEDLKKKLEF